MIEDGPARRSHECGLLGAAEPLQHRGEQRAELGQRAKLGGVEFGHLTEAHEMEDPCLLPVLAQHDLDDVAGTSGRVAVLAGSHAQAGQRYGDAGSAQDRTRVADVRGLRIGDTQREPGGHARIGENAIPRTGTMDGEQAAVAVDQYLNRRYDELARARQTILDNRQELAGAEPANLHDVDRAWLDGRTRRYRLP